MAGDRQPSPMWQCSTGYRNGLSNVASANAPSPDAHRLPDKSCNRDQEAQRQDLPRRRDAELQGEIVAESPNRLVAMAAPSPAYFEHHREQAGHHGQPRQRPHIGALSTPVQPPPGHEPEEHS